MAHQPFHLPEKQALFSTDTSPDAPPEGERWSTWDGATHGPKPRPDWVITDLGAVESDLGVLKTGKEADVHVLRRWVPGTDRSSTMAAKRYRNGDHRLFHRDAGYLEGRRVRKSREMRAMARRTDFGKQMIAGQWAAAEFDALGRLWELGLPVPYPVQLDESEMLMEFVGDTSGATPIAAPRLVSTRPEPDLLAELFEQLRSAMLTLARPRLGPRRPLAVQRPAPRGAPRAHRLAADRRRHRQPARVRLPRARRDDDGGVVHPQGPGRRRRGASSATSWPRRRAGSEGGRGVDAVPRRPAVSGT